MAIAVSDANLKEIYNLSYDEKLDLVDLILKSMRSSARIVDVKPIETNVSWVSQFEGQWKDSKSAEEMVMDLRRSRTRNHFARIEGIQIENWVER